MYIKFDRTFTFLDIVAPRSEPSLSRKDIGIVRHLFRSVK